MFAANDELEEEYILTSTTRNKPYGMFKTIPHLVTCTHNFVHYNSTIHSFSNLYTIKHKQALLASRTVKIYHIPHGCLLLL